MFLAFWKHIQASCRTLRHIRRPLRHPRKLTKKGLVLHGGQVQIPNRVTRVTLKVYSKYHLVGFITHPDPAL